MKKNIILLLITFTLLQLPVLVNAQTIYLKLGDFSDPDNNTEGYKGLIGVIQVGAGVGCSPCTVPIAPKPGEGMIVPQKIVFNVLALYPSIFIKNLMLKRIVTPSAFFVFTITGPTKPLPYYWIALSNVVVEEINEVSTSGNQGTVGEVQVTLAYSAITFKMQNYTNTGTAAGPPVLTGWDFKANKPIILPI
jgi:hypothetical protein